MASLCDFDFLSFSWSMFNNTQSELAMGGTAAASIEMMEPRGAPSGIAGPWVEGWGHYWVVRAIF